MSKPSQSFLVGVSRHDVPLGERASHLRVDEVGLELAFALDVDDAATGAHVAQREKDTAGLLGHLERGEGEGEREGERERGHGSLA